MHFCTQTQPTNSCTEILTPVQDHTDFKSAPLGHRPHLHRLLLQKEDQKRMRPFKKYLTKLSKMIKVPKSKSAIQKGIKAFVHGWGKKKILQRFLKSFQGLSILTSRWENTVFLPACSSSEQWASKGPKIQPHKGRYATWFCTNRQLRDEGTVLQHEKYQSVLLRAPHRIPSNSWASTLSSVVP